MKVLPSSVATSTATYGTELKANTSVVNTKVIIAIICLFIMIFIMNKVKKVRNKIIIIILTGVVCFAIPSFFTYSNREDSTETTLERNIETIELTEDKTEYKVKFLDSDEIELLKVDDYNLVLVNDEVSPALPGIYTESEKVYRSGFCVFLHEVILEKNSVVNKPTIQVTGGYYSALGAV